MRSRLRGAVERTLRFIWPRSVDRIPNVSDIPFEDVDRVRRDQEMMDREIVRARTEYQRLRREIVRRTE